MTRKRLAKITLLLPVIGFFLGLFEWRSAQATGWRQEPPPPQPQVIYPVRHDLSHRLSTASHELGITQEPGEPHSLRPLISPIPLPKAENAFPLAELEPDAALQTLPVVATMPGTQFNFEGISNINSALPPDTNGDVGLNHYVQWVNLSLAIWQLDRETHTFTLVFGPVTGNTIWNGFGGSCQTSNHGDPIVLYDHLADRWFISQFALPYYPSGPFYQCIAVSQTGDPTGAWFRYAYEWKGADGLQLMNDYPKFGVWPDAYYLSVNQFASGTSAWRGAGVAAFERDKMLLGLPARMVYFDLYGVNQNYGGMLPSDLDGPPPPAGTPNYFVEADDSSWIGPVDALRIWQFHVDWKNLDSSTFGLAGEPDQTLPIAGFTPFFNQSAPRKIPQPGTSVRLDSLADRLMYRLQYRYFGSHASLVTNHTVDAGNGRAAVRWYELRELREPREAGSGWAVYQQGTYAGDGPNSLHRWMASAAMDLAGNIAVGFSTSSSVQYPSIAYTGRLAGDPLNALPQGEAMLLAGNGSQTYSNGRWGDYSMMSVDPTDGCTFWYTNEYLQITSSAGWRTRIGSFAFPSCFGQQTGSLAGTVTSNGNPLASATVQAGQYSTQTGADGSYYFPALPVGVYSVTASAYGYQPQTVNGVPIDVNGPKIQNFSLAFIPISHVHGLVRDDSGQGWPLYARIEITAPGYSNVIFTNPVSGLYHVDLSSNTEHTFQVTAQGYMTQTIQVDPLPPDTARNFALGVNPDHCNAPGYVMNDTCAAQNPGGLLIGHVYDANDPDVALIGATVTSQAQMADTTLTFATPGDPDQEDGLYILFSSLTGTHPFKASFTGYATPTQGALISDGGITPLDFFLPAGRLAASPSSLSEMLVAPQVVTDVLTLTNIGTWGANFSISEVDAPAQVLLPTGPFARPTRHASPKRLGDLNASAVFEYNPPPVGQLSGGGLLSHWTTSLVHPWGIGINTLNGDAWIGDVAVAGGDDHLHRFLPGGPPTGESIDTSSSGAYYSAGIVFNPFSGKFWQVSVGGDNCLVEVDPVADSLTGQKICPPFDHSQRGLAFNPLNRSFYSGAWTNGILYHFDEAGTILDSANLDLNISGLAFNPATRHLFVLSNANAGFDIYVLDADHGYNLLGGFDIPGLGDFEQAGLSIDCDAHLWVVNQVTAEVFEVDSGESAACAYAEIAWLSVNPGNGDVSQGGSRSIDVIFNAAAAPAGISQASLLVGNNTPYGPLTIPITLYNGPLLYLPLISR